MLGAWDPGKRALWTGIAKQNGWTWSRNQDEIEQTMCLRKEHGIVAWIVVVQLFVLLLLHISGLCSSVRPGSHDQTPTRTAFRRWNVVQNFRTTRSWNLFQGQCHCLVLKFRATFHWQKGIQVRTWSWDTGFSGFQYWILCSLHNFRSSFQWPAEMKRTLKKQNARKQNRCSLNWPQAHWTDTICSRPLELCFNDPTRELSSLDKNTLCSSDTVAPRKVAIVYEPSRVVWPVRVSPLWGKENFSPKHGIAVVLNEEKCVLGDWNCWHWKCIVDKFLGQREKLKLNLPLPTSTCHNLSSSQNTRLYQTIIRITIFTIGLEGHGWLIISRADIGLPVYPRPSVLGGKNKGQP